MKDEWIHQHKRLLVQAQLFRDKDPSYTGWSFVDSLIKRVKNNKELSWKQCSLLQWHICELHWRSIENTIMKNCKDR